jgi:hypothetical protein
LCAPGVSGRRWMTDGPAMKDSLADGDPQAAAVRP